MVHYVTPARPARVRLRAGYPDVREPANYEPASPCAPAEIGACIERPFKLGACLLNTIVFRGVFERRRKIGACLEK